MKLKDLVPVPKLNDNMRHYHTTTKTTPKNGDATNPKSSRNKKNIQLELKAAVSKKSGHKSMGKDKRAHPDKEMTLSTVNTKSPSPLQESFAKE